MKKRQLAKLGLTVGLVGAVGVGGTLAILSQQSNTVTNTFAVGAGIKAEDVVLDETDLQDKALDAEMSDNQRTQTGNAYNDLQPGMKLTKDPQVHVTAKAADSYVFAKLENVDEYLAAMNEGVADEDKSALIHGINTNWKLYQAETAGSLDGVYVYVGASNPEKGIEAGENGEGSKVSVGDITFDSEKLFEGIQLATAATLYDAEGNPKDLSKLNIVVKALAVQATDAATSWADAQAVVDDFEWK